MLLVSSDNGATAVAEAEAGQLHGTDGAAERFSLSETHLASDQTGAADDTFEAARQGVPVLISQRHALLLNKIRDERSEAVLSWAWLLTLGWMTRLQVRQVFPCCCCQQSRQ